MLGPLFETTGIWSIVQWATPFQLPNLLREEMVGREWNACSRDPITPLRMVMEPKYYAEEAIEHYQSLSGNMTQILLATDCYYLSPAVHFFHLFSPLHCGVSSAFLGHPTIVPWRLPWPQGQWIVRTRKSRHLELFGEGRVIIRLFRFW